MHMAAQRVLAGPDLAHWLVTGSPVAFARDGLTSGVMEFLANNHGVRSKETTSLLN